MQRLSVRRPARPRDQDHEARQVSVLAAQTVKRPGSERRPTGNLMPRLQQSHCRIMVDGFGVESTHQAQMIGHPACVWKQFAEPGAPAAVTLELENRGSDGE